MKDDKTFIHNLEEEYLSERKSVVEFLLKGIDDKVITNDFSKKNESGFRKEWKEEKRINRKNIG